MPHGTVASERFDEFRALHTEGLGRNAIARAMGIPPCVASRTAEHLGLDFDRSKIAAATQARLADLAERRAILAERLTEAAEKALTEMDEPTLVFAFGGKENTFASEWLDKAPANEKRALMGTAGMAIDRSLRLAPAEAAGGADEAKSMLGKLAEGIAAMVNDSGNGALESGEGQ
ncbi:hypothetical protein AB0C91_10085 [Streptomyces sp. NPDC048674]|uniref:hypothetical protein n=1 Tax=Streptomyces sp. NPDC048674 TaxID=3155491 RepID=UPI0034495311